MILLNINYAQGQKCSSCCVKDSTKFDSINQYFSHKYTIDNFDYYFHKYITNPQGNNYLCSLVSYAKFFDFLLSKGLDVNFSALKNPFGRISGVYINPPPEEIERRRINQENYIKQYTYRHFLEAKKSYEHRVIRDFYRAENISSFESEVESLVNMGGYRHPTILRNILLNKYKKHTLERLDQEIYPSKN